MAAQTTTLAALVTKVVGGLSAGMLQAGGGATTLSAALSIKFGGGFLAGIVIAYDRADDVFGNPGHQIW